jgi:parvulin-like peptidyl-prolyl isomerase
MRYLLLLTSLCAGLTCADEPAPQVPTALPSDQAAASSQQVAPVREPVVMARVGTETITVEEFMGFLVKNPQNIQAARTPEGKARLIRNAIENRLLLMALRDEGLLGKDAEATEEVVTPALKKLAQKHFPPLAAPDDEAVRLYYEAHKDAFSIPASARVSQIQIRVAPSATDEEKAAARARAQAALQRIEGGEPFGDVAAAVTEHPGARETKGDVGYLKRNVAEWFDRALAGIGVGQHTGVIQSPVGYEILLLTDTRDAVVTPFPEARTAAATALAAQEQTKVRMAYVKDLAKRYGASIELEELKGAFPNGIFP